MQDDFENMCDCEVIHEDQVAKVRGQLPAEEDFQDLVQLFQMFSNRTRVMILWALSQETLCVCDLAALLGMTRSAVSHQLRLLRVSNLVSFVKKGKVVYYSLADDHVRDIFANGFDHIHE